jgi:hypothetical protein
MAPRIETTDGGDGPSGCRTGIGRFRSTYLRREPERTVLHAVVREHLETFLAEAKVRGGGDGVPGFVERELRDYLSCGVMARGFARFRCSGCRREILVAFSCKGRGFCPSCCGRRMCVLAAHLVDGVLGDLPLRQWVLTLPFRLRYVLAFDHELCRKVLAVFVRALLAFERRRAAARGVVGRGGAITAIQRCGSALNTNIHFHTLVAEGVFVEDESGDCRFEAAERPPTDVEVGGLLAAVRRRIVRLVRRHGIELDGESGVDDMDELALESPVMAHIRGATVVGVVATGPRAGRRVLRLGANPGAPVVTTNGPRQARLGRFDLHANTAVPARARGRLERLCRYILRPPLALGALGLTADGKVLLRLRRRWRDGTQAIRFEPSELMERLAAMVPRPRTNLLIYHGAFAPRGCARRGARDWLACRLESPPAPGWLRRTGWQRPERDSGPEETGDTGESAAPVGAPGCTRRGGDGEASGADHAGNDASAALARPPPGYVRPRHVAWAELLRRVFEIDVLACPDCGGRLRLLATIEDPAIAGKILEHLGLEAEPPAPAAALPLTWLPGFEPEWQS